MNRTSPPKPQTFHGRYLTYCGAVITVENNLFVARVGGDPEVQLTFDGNGRATSKDGARLPNYDIREMVRPGAGQ